MTKYIAILRKEEGTDYGVDFPDFPGAVTAGRTLDEAYEMAVEALSVHVDGMIEDGEAISEPSSFEAVMADPHNHDGGVAILIDLPAKSTRTIRVNVTLPQDLIEAIDRVADNRSRFLTEAARERLQISEKSIA